MNWAEMQRDWNQLKMFVKTQWTKLTGEDLNFIDGRRVNLAAALERRYDLTGGEVERAIAEFEKDLRRPGAVK